MVGWAKVYCPHLEGVGLRSYPMRNPHRKGIVGLSDPMCFPHRKGVWFSSESSCVSAPLEGIGCRAKPNVLSPLGGT
jgi:hypothetical protein